MSYENTYTEQNPENIRLAQEIRHYLKTHKKPRKPLSQYHPSLYFLSSNLRRLHRKLIWLTDSQDYASYQSEERLEYRVFKHQSVLLRKLGDTDMQLQHNKVENLKCALPFINGLIIKPGETFSFCKLVGRPTEKRGFRYGMELSFGKARPGVGGGLCQITNLIHWLILHSPLTVRERHHHSFDPFPDSGRVLPFGSGAAVFYNYLDYQFTNTTPYTFQLRLWLSEKCLEGELRSDQSLPTKYTIFQKNHIFLEFRNNYYRSNEIWRKEIEKGHNGKEIDLRLLTKNIARMGYTPPWYILETETI